MRTRFRTQQHTHTTTHTHNTHPLAAPGKSPARNSKTKVARKMKGSGAQALESLAESSMEEALPTLNQVKTIQRDFKTTRTTDNVTTPVT